MEEHWYVNPEVSGSSPGPVKFSFPNFQIASCFVNMIPMKVSKPGLDVHEPLLVRAVVYVALNGCASRGVVYNTVSAEW